MAKNDFSQYWVAKQLGKKGSWISRILNGKNNFTMKTILEFEKFFGEDIITIVK